MANTPDSNVVRLETGEKSIDCEPEFEDFYALYPRKVARKSAALAWHRLSAGDRRAAFVGLVEWRRVWEYERSRREDFFDFIPHPATWLNGERWTDEVPAQFKRPVAIANPGVGGVAREVDQPRAPMPQHAVDAIRRLREKARDAR
jgi:hypothetical protein